MLRHRLMLAAETLIRDGDSNNVSAITIFEEFTFAAFPYIVPRLMVLTVLERDQDDADKFPLVLDITIAGQSLASINFEIDFQGLNRTRGLLFIGGMPIPQPGTLRITVSHQGQELAHYDIEVKTSAKAEARIIQPAQAPAG